ncbi:MAG: EAL domain-containing protein [Acidimicrobiales bacterium]
MPSTDGSSEATAAPARPPDLASSEVDPERVALGLAVQARAEEVGRAVEARFKRTLGREAFATSRLATELIGRWIATGEAATHAEESELSRQGEKAILEAAELADVAKAYFAWRDKTIGMVDQEATRLATPAEVTALVRRVVRLSCDGSLVRIVRQFDQTHRSLQQQLKDEQATLAHRALHDELTGLANRTLLIDRLRHAGDALARKGTHAMVHYLDLDNLKAVNDRFGHSAGDSLLCAVAVRLRGLVRSSDTVARLGGDEFVVLTEDVEDPDLAAKSLAERIHLAMRPPIPLGVRSLHTSVSIGIAPVVLGQDPEVCLARADVAMYEAKRGGPARFESYSDEIGKDNQRRSQLADELRVAAELGQLSVHYQPLFALGGEICGVEALLRWQHPELGAVQPVEFIPLLEQSREIIPVGRWVLCEATRQCRTWQDQGLEGLSVSVNVSARQLQEPEFFHDVVEALARSGLEAGSLVLEVTESVLVMDIARIGSMMRTVRDLGVHIALDDFGTGFSSLLYLQGLPIDRLKVDRSFVSGLGTADRDPTIVSTVVELAHKLGLRVVAEGVETEAELDAIEAMGCDEAQGFLLGRPGPAELFTLGRRELSSR